MASIRGTAWQRGAAAVGAAAACSAAAVVGSAAEAPVLIVVWERFASPLG
ncbi:hypothetical protein ACWEPH_00430 [Nocardia beijingensis]